jgi:ribosomal protein S13
VEGALRSEMAMNIKRLMDIGAYAGCGTAAACRCAGSAPRPTPARARAEEDGGRGRSEAPRRPRREEVA